jgi:hypothetical protein
MGRLQLSAYIRKVPRPTSESFASSLLPKALKVERRSPYEDMTEEEIDAKIRMLLTSISAKLQCNHEFAKPSSMLEDC